jgi:hypothetical protein
MHDMLGERRAVHEHRERAHHRAAAFDDGVEDGVVFGGDLGFVGDFGETCQASPFLDPGFRREDDLFLFWAPGVRRGDDELYSL